MNKPMQRFWTFRSDSNPDVAYQTLQYADQSMSCNCPGWTRRIASDGSRSCKHTRWVDVGMADRLCSATRDYGTAKLEKQNAKKQIKPIPRLGERKFSV
ncbi:MAG: hypothetical protein ABIP71_07090 [Verrucomicrobiota bacterium]